MLSTGTLAATASAERPREGAKAASPGRESQPRVAIPPPSDTRTSETPDSRVSGADHDEGMRRPAAAQPAHSASAVEGLGLSRSAEERAAREGPVIAADGPPEAVEDSGEQLVVAGVSKEDASIVRGDGGDNIGKNATRDALASGEEGLIYVNTATGETVREPPAELMARSEEAEAAGDYLVFVPSRSFIAARTSSLRHSSGSLVGTAADKTVSAGADAVSPTANSSASEIAGGTFAALMTAEAERQPILKSSSASRDDGAGIHRNEPPAVPTPPSIAGTSALPTAAAAEAALRGGETWNRFSGVSESGTTPDHPRSSPQPHEPIDSACKPSDAVVVTGVSSPISNGAIISAAASTPSGFPMAIDLSQGACEPPLPVKADGVGVGGGGSAGKLDAMEEASEETGAGKEDFWACIACTLQNKAHLRVCSVCGTPKPKHLMSQVWNCFRFVFSCSRASTLKRVGIAKPYWQAVVAIRREHDMLAEPLMLPTVVIHVADDGGRRIKLLERVTNYMRSPFLP